MKVAILATARAVRTIVAAGLEAGETGHRLAPHHRLPQYDPTIECR